MPIYGDLYQNLQWSFTFNLKVVTYLKSASEASHDVIKMATINRKGSLIKAIVCIGIVVLNPHKFFLSHNIIYFSHMMVKSSFFVTLIIGFLSKKGILHAKYRIFPIIMINTQLISRPKRCVYL